MCQHRLGGHGGVFMRFDDEDRPLFPFGMENADNSRELHARAGDCGVLDIDRAHPFATRLDDVFLAVGDAHEAVLVYRGDIASVEPAACIKCARLAEIVAPEHPGYQDADRAGTLPVDTYEQGSMGNE